MVSKFIAVLLLPVYTRYIHPSGYGVVELLANGVIFISILVRFGMIEAFLRYYFTDAGPGAPRRARPPGGRCSCWSPRTIAAIAARGRRGAAVEARARLPRHDDLPDRRARAVVVHEPRARLRAAARRRAAADLRDRVADQRRDHGRRLAGAGRRPRTRGRGACCSATTAPRRSCCSGCGGRCAGACCLARRSGGPAAPSGSRCCCASACRRCRPRPRCTRSASSTATTSTTPAARRSPGLYSIAVKLAGAVAFIVRAFQYAWPPLAYSVTDDAEAARLYGLVTTYYVAGQRLGRRRAGAARALGAAAADGARVLRRLPGAAVGRARAGRCTACGSCSW